jgi:hypothetical protein
LGGGIFVVIYSLQLMILIYASVYLMVINALLQADYCLHERFQHRCWLGCWRCVVYMICETYPS